MLRSRDNSIADCAVEGGAVSLFLEVWFYWVLGKPGFFLKRPKLMGFGVFVSFALLG